MQQQVRAELKQELHRMEVSSQPKEFEKHVYAMERLIGLLKQDNGAAAPSVAHAFRENSSGMSANDREMLRMMGGRAEGRRETKSPEQSERLPAETLDTDDGFGNGDSLFDF